MNLNLQTLFQQHLETQIQRHQDAISRADCDGVAIFSGVQKYLFQDDRSYPFRSSPLFLSWAPLQHHPHCWIVFRPGQKPRLIYFQPDDYWHSPPADPEGFWVDGFDIQIIAEPDEARPLLGADLDRLAFLGEELDLAEAWGFGSTNPDPVVKLLHYRRAAKTDYELACMRVASRSGVAAHRAAEAAFRRGESEYAIHLAYQLACAHTEQELPYSNIIALNEHGAVLHYGHYDRQPPALSRSFLIDAGAQFNGYASDITRSYASEPGEFADLIEAMDDVQRALASGARAGVDYRDLHQQAHHRIAGVLCQFGFVRGDADGVVDSGLSSVFFPHGLGHLIGLQVHDVGGFMASEAGGTIPTPEQHPFLRLTRVLEPGFVLTIEPGLYFIDPLLRKAKESRLSANIVWDKVDAFRAYGGIRIEDDVVVRADGAPENLTRDAYQLA